MNICFILNILVVVIGLLFMSSANSDKNRKVYICICFALLLFCNAFKSLSVGPDTFTYYHKYVECSTLSWSETWNSFIQAYIYGQSDYDEGYTVYTKFVQIFSKDFIFFLFFSSLLSVIPLGVILYKYCNRIIDLLFAFVLYITLIYNGGSMLSRQQIATAFLFMAFLCILKNRYFWSLFLIAIAFFMHRSSAVFIVVPLIAKFAPKITKPFHVVSFLLIPVFILFSSQILVFAAAFLGSDRYASYAETEFVGGITFVTLMEILSLICLLGFKKDYLQQNDLARKIYIMAPFFTMFAPLILRDGVFIRLSKYFHVFLIAMIPMAFCQIFKKSSVNIALFVTISILVIYTYISSGKYYFIWQEPYMHYIGG